MLRAVRLPSTYPSTSHAPAGIATWVGSPLRARSASGSTSPLSNSCRRCATVIIRVMASTVWAVGACDAQPERSAKLNWPSDQLMSSVTTSSTWRSSARCRSPSSINPISTAIRPSGVPAFSTCWRRRISCTSWVVSRSMRTRISPRCTPGEMWAYWMCPWSK